MNIIQAQNTLKDLSDGQLQKQLLNPDGSVPSFLVLSELQRRKDMRDSYAKQEQNGSSMAEEFSKGLGQAKVGNYSEALRGAMPGATPPQQPMGQPPMQMAQAPVQGGMPQGPQPQPMPEQGYADGGAVEAEKAPGGAMAILAPGLENRASLQDYALGPVSGLIEGKSLGDSLGDHFKNMGNLALQGPALRAIMGGKNLFADGGLVAGDTDRDNQPDVEADRSMMVGMPHDGGPAYAAGGGIFSMGRNPMEVLNAFGNPLGARAAEYINPSPMQTLAAGLAAGAGGQPSSLMSQITGNREMPGSGLPSASAAPSGPMAPGASSPMGVLAAMGGSADGATGDGSGNGGDAGGVGAGVGTGVGDAAASAAAAAADAASNSDAGAAGMARGGVVRFAEGGDTRWWMPDMSRLRGLLNTPSRDIATMGAEALRTAPTDQWAADYQAQQEALAAQRDVAARDWRNPFWRVSRGKSEVPGWGLQDYPPDLKNDPSQSAKFPPVGRDVGETGSVPPPTPETGGTPEMGVPGTYPVVPGSGLPSAAAPPGSPAGGPAGGAAAARGGAGVGAGGGGAGGPSRGLNLGGSELQDYWNQVQGLRLPNRFDAIEQANREDREKLEKGVEGSKGEALLAAGLGIMGGESPFAAVNIGRGAQVGIKQWNDAQKEMRVAQQAIRQADNQIAIAKATRDDSLLQSTMKLKEQAQQKALALAEMANRAGIASADRAANRELKEREFEANKLDRDERRDQSRITDFGTQAKNFASIASQAEAKLAALSANPLASTPEVAAQIAEAQKQVADNKAAADHYGSLYRDAIVQREIRLGNIKKVGTPEEASKLPKGTRIVTPDGRIGVVK